MTAFDPRDRRMYRPKPKNGRQLIYVHGTNGSGKSTLARHVLMASGGRYREIPCPSGGASLTTTHTGPVLVGRYRSATGGADGVQPYGTVVQALQWIVRKSLKNIFLEGLMTPGVETCRTIFETAQNFGVECTFILLDVPVERCIGHVRKRRARKGNVEIYDPSRLLTKDRSARSWANNLKNAGIPVRVLKWEQAREYVYRKLTIGPGGATGILDD